MTENKELTKRVCNACGIEKDIDEFYNDKSRIGGKSYTCKKCKNSHSKTYQSRLTQDDYDNGVLNNAKRRARYYAKYKDTSIKNYGLIRKYGIDIDKFNEMLEETNGVCQICGNDMKKVVIDHNHRTGKVRGIICGHCNSLLGFAKDDIKTLEMCIKYLEKNND